MTELPPTSTTNTFRPEDVFATLAGCRRTVGRLAAGRNLAFTTLARSLEHARAGGFEPFAPMRFIPGLSRSSLDKARTAILPAANRANSCPSHPAAPLRETAVAAARLVVAEVRPRAVIGGLLRQLAVLFLLPQSISTIWPSRPTTCSCVASAPGIRRLPGVHGAASSRLNRLLPAPSLPISEAARQISHT